GPGPTGRVPTAKPNVSSRACFGNGPTSALTPRQPVAPQHCLAGCTATTSTALTVVLVHDHRSPGWSPHGEQRAWKAHLDEGCCYLSYSFRDEYLPPGLVPNIARRALISAATSSSGLRHERSSVFPMARIVVLDHGVQ